MTPNELKQKALSLPYLPGVYIMRDCDDNVIYVGKAKKLKNRVSQYFQDTAAHTPKTRRMVSQIDHFDTIVAGSEFEALVLECSLIKHHMPRYNILLKDDKGYPYLKIDWKKPYPVMELSGKVLDDGAEYFGPFGGRFLTQKVMDVIRVTLKLPGCSRTFPRDIGKSRPCLNAHIGNCAGWCSGAPDGDTYRKRMQQAAQLLRGKHREVIAEWDREREKAAQELRFEQAAALRDRIRAVQSLAQKQIVTNGSSSRTDAIGFYENELKCGFSVLHFIGGSLLEKEYRVLPAGEDRAETLGALVKQYYLSGKPMPKQVLLPFEIDDMPLLEEFALQRQNSKVRFHVPKRGEGCRLVSLAVENAKQEAERITSREEKLNGTLVLLGKMMQLNKPPMRLEAYDISHTDGKDIVASMTVFVDGKPAKKQYRLFQIRDLENQDDYASMQQVIFRRFSHYLAGDAAFSVMPDALLLDGGEGQIHAAELALGELGLAVPAFGMVKDNRHRTRALVTSDGSEIGISGEPSVFSLIGRIQEETHRFAVGYHRKLQSGHLKASGLERISGVGPKRSAMLLDHFRTIKKIREATREELSSVVPDSTAEKIFEYFHSQEQPK